MNSFKEKFNKEIVQVVMKKHNLVNIYQVPRLKKVTLNIGISKTKKDPKLYEVMVSSLTSIAGQKPNCRLAKRAISGFGVRKGMKVGLAVTLRGERMYEFVSKFIHIVLPRVRDFHGISNKSLDKFGNLTIGIKEHIVFPEINPDTISKLHGLEVSFSMSGDSRKLKRDTLKLMGFPFKDPKVEKEEEKTMEKKEVIKRIAISKEKPKAVKSAKPAGSAKESPSAKEDSVPSIDKALKDKTDNEKATKPGKDKK